MPEVIRPDGAVVHYEMAGSGPPLLALAPGGVSSEPAQWQHRGAALMAALTQRFTVINMSQRYAGLSRAPLTAYSYDDAVGDQLAVLDAQGIESALVLGGGYGANWALRLAYDAPARVSAVCLLRPAGKDDSNRMNDFYAIFNDTIRVARADGLEGVIATALENACFLDNPAAGPWAARLHHEPEFRQTLRSLGRETYITLVVDFRDGFCPVGRQFFALNDVALSRISVPALVFPGEDTVHPKGAGQALAQMLNDACVGEAGDTDAQIVAFFERAALS